MITGAPLVLIFLLSVAVLLVLIMKFRLNAFVALILTAIVTAVVAGMPLANIGGVITEGFGGTLGSIAMVTGFGVILGRLMYESGGIENLATTLLNKMGDKKSPLAVGLSGFITGIPVFGDVVYIMFAPMLRVLSKKTKISMTCYACAISIATTCTYALVLPTAPPLVVAGELGIEIGVFFVYAIACAFIGMLVGGIIYGHYRYYTSLDYRRIYFWSNDISNSIDFIDVSRCIAGVIKSGHM
ncbi:GntP family permease [Candidatus Epulonipiscium viviparus]|uniref:GntP family permease n=1 Tax=Candidatus Epulonipiscium viviparus TaxID=420336 RepID=UPI0027380D11|nr:SLC13 family permease [Candidatus Epulopiscium viviparus]